MKLATYQAIVQELHSLRKRDCLAELQSCFPDVSELTLRSIIACERQRKTKKQFHHFMSAPAADEHYDYYVKCAESGEKPGFLLRYADEQGVTPGLMARLIIEKKHATEAGPPSKSAVSQMLRDSASIKDGTLATEVFMCVSSDDSYGPLADAKKCSVGLEYEIQLKTELAALGLTFADETVLRERGYDKTPDVKLEVPVIVDGAIVTWVESKAQFGDPESHQTYARDQYRSYWNRFGCGLVIYWFGFVDEISTGCDEGFLIRDHMPTNIAHMHEVLNFS